MMILFLILTLGTGVWTKPSTGPVSDQPLCFNVTDPDAMEIDRIYEWDKDKDNLFERNGLPLSDCSESGSVGLDTCRVCEGGGQVLALCHLSNPSADLRFETNDKYTPLRTTQCDSAVSLKTLTNLTLALQSQSAPPGLGAGYTALIVLSVLAVLVVAVLGVVFTQRKKSWMNSFTSVRAEDTENEM